MIVGVDIRESRIHVSSFLDGAARILFSLRLPQGMTRRQVLLQGDSFCAVFDSIRSRLRNQYGVSSVELILCVPESFGIGECLDLRRNAWTAGFPVRNLFTDTMALACYLDFREGSAVRRLLIGSTVDAGFGLAEYDLGDGIIEKGECYVADCNPPRPGKLPLLERDQKERLCAFPFDGLVLSGEAAANARAAELVNTLLCAETGRALPLRTLEPGCISLGLGFYCGVYTGALSSSFALNTYSPFSLYLVYQNEYYPLLTANATFPLRRECLQIPLPGRQRVFQLYERRRDGRFLEIGSFAVNETLIPALDGEGLTGMKLFAELNAAGDLDLCFADKDGNTLGAVPLPEALRLKANQVSEEAGAEPANALEALLSVVDSLEYGIKAYGSDAANPHLQGLLQIYSQALGRLAKLGVTRIEAEGQRFDPLYHSAVSQEFDPAYPPSTVKAVVQSGYLRNGRVLRCALVIVAN